MRRAEEMQKLSLNPALVFFDKNLKEHQIQKCVSIIQGDKVKDDGKVSHSKIMIEISETLMSGQPLINIMFGPGLEYRYDQIPGFITAPFNFTETALKDYVNQNVQQCREEAKKFVALQQSYDNTLESLQRVLPNVQVLRDKV